MVLQRSGSKPRLLRRRGYTVFEFTICVILLMAASTVTLKTVAVIGTERRAADRQLWVNEALSNAMERLADEPYDSLDTAKADAALKAAGIGRELPSAEWKGDVKNLADAKRLSLSVRWKTRSGEWIKPVRLTSWVYPRRKPS